MEQIEEHVSTDIDYEHKFYCDKCNKFLGSSYEYDDGYVPNPDGLHESGIHWYFDNEWFGLDGHYCIECVQKIYGQVYKFFDEMGIKKEKY